MLLLLVQNGNQAENLLSDSVLIAIIAASAGILISGIVNFFLQRFQDKRRFENERTLQKDHWNREDEVQKQRWNREDEAQKQRWNKEDRLRNYEERRQTYTALMQATDEAQLTRAQQGTLVEDALEYRDTVSRLSAELRMLSPFAVRGMGERLIQAFLECFDAHLRNSGDTGVKDLDLRERRYLFMRVAQKDLGLEREEDHELLKMEYQEIQKLKKSLGDR